MFSLPSIIFYADGPLNRYLHPSTYISALKKLSAFPKLSTTSARKLFPCVAFRFSSSSNVVPQSHKRVHAFIKLNWITTYKKLYHHGAAFHPFVDEQKLCFECSESYLVVHIKESERKMMKKLCLVVEKVSQDVNRCSTKSENWLGLKEREISPLLSA